jgi:N-terminal domain of anti-restriction factor ArdC
MKVEQAKQIASKAIEELTQALERGHSEKLIGYLAAMGRFHRYSLHNLMLIVSQRPEATRVAGYQTWRQLGRQVKKGAKGILILAPILLRKAVEQAGQEEQPVRVAVGFREVYVFDLADTDGQPLPGLAHTEGDPTGYTERLKAFLTERGIRLEYSEVIYPAQGLCVPGSIVLLPGQSPAEEFATLAHETAHALLHQQERRADTTRSIRETEAEAVAFVVCESIGLKAQRSADYIQLYCGDKDLLAESLEHVQRASSEILVAITQTD